MSKISMLLWRGCWICALLLPHVETQEVDTLVVDETLRPLVVALRQAEEELQGQYEILVMESNILDVTEESNGAKAHHMYNLATRSTCAHSGPQCFKEARHASFIAQRHDERVWAGLLREVEQKAHDLELAVYKLARTDSAGEAEAIAFPVMSRSQQAVESATEKYVLAMQLLDKIHSMEIYKMSVQLPLALVEKHSGGVPQLRIGELVAMGSAKNKDAIEPNLLAAAHGASFNFESFLHLTGACLGVISLALCTWLIYSRRLVPRGELASPLLSSS
mmetsp:Transcript_2372/g.5026  ORF Transcript_2372/g.5026 Transcript_2372/m.5026 type:complete len:277 (-) Transcript_2372:44-874(-)